MSTRCVPKDRVLSYETQIKAGKFVIIAHGTSDDVGKGRTALAGATHYEGMKHACCEWISLATALAQNGGPADELFVEARASTWSDVVHV